MLAPAQNLTIEVCNSCGGLVGWEQWREGCCLGGIVCKRKDGTRFVRPLTEEQADAIHRDGFRQ